MNVKTLIAAVALTVGSASAFAAGTTPASGEFNMIGNADASLTSVARQNNDSGLSRAAVIAELKRAAARGELAVNGEDVGLFAQNQADQSGLTRAAVIAEFKRAAASGELPVNGEFAG